MVHLFFIDYTKNWTAKESSLPIYFDFRRSCPTSYRYSMKMSFGACLERCSTRKFSELKIIECVIFLNSDFENLAEYICELLLSGFIR